jgi:hypothetical protein
MLSIISSGSRGCCSSTVPIRELPLFRINRFVRVLKLLYCIWCVTKCSLNLVQMSVFQILEFHHSTEINNKLKPRYYSNDVSEEHVAYMFTAEVISWWKPQRKQPTAFSLVPFLAVSFDREDVGDMFLRNVSWLSMGEVLYPRIK